MEKYKNWISIILFIATVIGWIVSKQVSTARLEKDIEYLQKQVDELSDLSKSQIELNGKIIQYMSHD